MIFKKSSPIKKILLAILLLSILYLGMLPIQPSDAPNQYVFPLYIIVSTIAALIGLVCFVIYILRGHGYMPFRFFFVGALMILYGIGGVLGAVNEGSSVINAIFWACFGFCIGCCGVEIGSILNSASNQRVKYISSISILLLLGFLIFILFKLSQDSLLEIIIKRYFILQSMIIVLVQIWIFSFSKISFFGKVFCALILLPTILVTGSRSLLVASIIYIALSLLYVAIKGGFAYRFIILTCGLLFLGISLFNYEIDLVHIYGARVSEGFILDSSRQIIWGFYMDRIFENPFLYLFGVGGSFGYVELASSVNDMFVTIKTPHNLYIMLLSSIGAIGFCVFIYFLIKIWKSIDGIIFSIFVAIFGVANDLIIFPIYSSQIINMFLNP
jgi:O-antigen ligase